MCVCGGVSSERPMVVREQSLGALQGTMDYPLPWKHWF